MASMRTSQRPDECRDAQKAREAREGSKQACQREFSSRLPPEDRLDELFQDGLGEKTLKIDLSVARSKLGLPANGMLPGMSVQLKDHQVGLLANIYCLTYARFKRFTV